MAHTLKTLGVIAACLSLLGLAACGTANPTLSPTTDLNPFRTEVAATVLAQVTFDLALTPSITPLPTATPQPTSTPTQAASPTPLVTATLPPGDTPVTLPGETITATRTVDATELAAANRAQWVSQSIPDNTTFAPGEAFTMTWQLRNVGTSTWTEDFIFRFYSGDTFGAPKEMLLGRQVPPGETVDITLKMKAPLRTGDYSSVWVMATEARGNFKEPVYLQIKVVVPPTATRAP